MSWHPQGRRVLVDGRSTYCVDVGQGPPVLFLHGFLHSSWTWRAAVEGLAERHRVIVPDLLGYGLSCKRSADRSLEAQVAWVSGLLEALDIGPLHGAVGNSWGGALLLRLALDDPGRVGRLVLVSPLGKPLPLPDLPLRMLGHKALGRVFRLTAGNKRFVRQALRLTAYKGRPVDADVLAGFEHLAHPDSHQVAVQTARQFRPAGRSLVQDLHRLEVPTTLVWGKRDLVLPFRYGRRLAERLPHQRFEVWGDCGHCPHEEQPERFVALLEQELSLPQPEGLVLPAPAPTLRWLDEPA